MAVPLSIPTPMDAASYAMDAWQRSVLFLDVMRQRGAQYEEHTKSAVPNVLDYEAELVLDGTRQFARPVNYMLVRIVPPEGVAIDPLKRPFVVVDPRAGHGPGIGGFKAESEIGVAMKAGHAAYLVGFLPDPVAGQTIEDIARAEAVFLEKVIELHPEIRGQALRDRELPGGLGHDDGQRAAPRAVRADHHRGHAALLLGRRKG